MTPLEKASQMIVDYQLTFKSLSYEEAVQCSIRTVDDILQELELVCVDEMVQFSNRWKYWEEVKELLEKQSNKHHIGNTTEMIYHIVDTNEMVDQVPDVRKMVEDDNYLTPVDWLMDRIKWIHRETYDYLIKEGQYDVAKRTENAILDKTNELQSSQTEISDEEIDKASKYWNETTNPEMWTYKLAWKAGAKWYREQLKQQRK